MTEKIGVTISPEAVEALKEKYNLPEGALNEIIGNVAVTRNSLPLPAKEDLKPAEPEFMRQILKGDVGMGEALMYMDFMDRKERRDRREDKENDGTNKVVVPTASEIGKEVATALHNLGVVGKPVADKEEIPEWAKPVFANQEKIAERMKKEDNEKRDKELIDKATGPLKTELAKTAEQVAQLSKPSPEGKGPAKSVIDHYIEGRAKLKEAGILKDTPATSNIMQIGPDGVPTTGIPVKGEIPAALVYGPAIFKQVLSSVEDTADRIAKKYGLGVSEPAAEEKPLIPLPPKPTPKAPPAPVKETPVETAEPSGPLISLPEREKAESTQPPAEPVEIKIEEPTQSTELAEPIEVELAEPIKPEAASPESTREGLIVPPPQEEEKVKSPLCAKCGTPVTVIETSRGNRNRCPQCRKFTKVKKSEDNGAETSSNN